MSSLKVYPVAYSFMGYTGEGKYKEYVSEEEYFEEMEETSFSDILDQEMENIKNVKK